MKRTIHTSQPKEQRSHLSRFKMSMFLLGVFGILGAVGYRVYGLQVTDYEKYKAIAASQHTREYSLEGDRGGIFVQDIKTGGTFPVAINRKVYNIAIDARTIADSTPENQQKIRDALVSRFGTPSEEVDTLLADTESQWKLVTRGIPQEDIEDIISQRLRGLILEENQERFYPERSFAASVIGYMQKDQPDQGRYGVEQQYNDVLKGKDGFERKESDRRGVWLAVSDRDRVEPTQGSDLVLTLDHTIQFKMEETLETLVEKFNPKNAMGIVMDPQTGEILAMANAPDFDPNQYAEVEDINLFRNPSISNLYEPGSIFKPFTVGLGLEGGVITPETEYEDKGELTLNGYTIRNALSKVHGRQNMQYALDNSLNTGMVFIQQELGREAFVEGLLQKFRLGQMTGVDLPSEANPNLGNVQREIRDARDINYATASYGQGIAFTPLQMLTSFNAVANDGVIMKPRIVKEVRSIDGETTTFGAEEIGRALSPEATRELAKMMVSTVDNGHGRGAAVEGYSIGGKTGTAQIATAGGYGDDTLQSFIQFATLANPRYTLIISLDSPQGSRFSDGSVVPAVGELNEFLLNYFEIEADRITTE